MTEFSTAALLPAFLPGLFLGFSLIVAIGAQNAFVLRQGLRMFWRSVPPAPCRTPC